MTTLIFGATGTIGRSISSAFYRMNEPIIRVSTIDCDLTELSSVNLFLAQDRLKNLNTIIFCAGKYGGLKQYINEELDFAAFEANFEILVKNWASRRWVLISSASATFNFDPASNYFGYSEHKRRLEACLQKYTANYLIVRPTNFLGGTENLARSEHSIAAITRRILAGLKAENIEIWSHPEDWREYLECQFLARFIIFELQAWINNKRLCINIGSGYATSMKDIVDAASELLGYEGQFSFTEPRRCGPVPCVIGVPKHYNCDYDSDFFESLKRCYRDWGLI